ncbi:hypothetical protein [Vibrio jasicida]|uniref:Agl cluster protein AglQ n=1 Tax=Vibrio jasicida TaxID=766224 RepID=A0ABW7J8E0_9VIBR
MHCKFNEEIKNRMHNTGVFGLSLISNNGSMPSGHNGPYYDEEFSTRNTAHWIIIFLFNFKITGKKIWKDASVSSLNYLLSEECNQFGYTYSFRNKKEKDICNGVVGQAWIIECLVYAYEVLGEKCFLDEAIRLYRLHQFDKSVGIWSRVEIDGSILSPDPTFNHQLWFAYAGAMLSDHDSSIEEDVRIFIEKVVNNLSLYGNGVIYHASPMGTLRSYLSKGKKSFFSELKLRVRRLVQKKSLYDKSVGYFGFNLYALSFIDKKFPSLILSTLHNSFVNVGKDDGFIENLKSNIYGYYYNVSGIEISYYYKSQGDDMMKQLWYERQIEHSYTNEQEVLTRNSVDRNTALARTYQMMRLYDEG